LATGLARRISPALRIEIDPGGRRHARFFEQAAREGEAVGREARDIGIEVESTVSRQKAIEPCPRQPLQ